MDDHFKSIDKQIRVHYANLACERAMQPDLQKRFRSAHAECQTIDEWLDAHKTFWNAQPEVQCIYDAMNKELFDNEEEYYKCLQEY